jgi:hypothetical protein
MVREEILLLLRAPSWELSPLLTPIVSEKIGVDVTEGQKWAR